MGRGRAKAKQQKVARDLKYNAHPTDLTALQRELSGAGGQHESNSSYRSDGYEDSGDDVDDSDDWATASR
jgi:Protein of unknown function (DUF3073)